MKKVSLILIALFIHSIGISAQEVKTVTIPMSQLTQQQLAELEQEELEKKLQQYGNWVGVGGEIGTAVREGLIAVVDVADKAGNTDVGKFTMYLIAWKVVGKDIIRLFLGFIIAIIITIFIFKSAKKSFNVQRVLKSDPGLFKYPKEYEIINPIESNDDWHSAVWYKFFYTLILIGGYGIVYAIMFGG